MAVAKDAYPRDGQSQSFVVGFAEVEVDTETGVVTVIDYTAIADVGTVLNPRSLKGQLFGGSMLGLGHAHDAALGLRPAVRRRAGAALLPEQAADDSRRAAQLQRPKRSNCPDPETPTGIRGVGEPPVGAAYGAIMNAIADAVGDEIFRRSPVSPDIAAERARKRRQRTHEALTAHI